MTPFYGNAAARATFAAAMASGSLHHAWLFAGPEGVGKASFARVAALRLLADAASPGTLPPGFDVPEGHRTRALFAAGSHPDFRALVRLPKDPDKPDQDIARSIPIAQVRALQPMFAVAPAMSPRRIVLIDSIDDLERPGACNALLKNLEEPPQGTIFLLISHAPGKLLPTIRSRCRLLRFEALKDDDVRAAIRAAQPEATEAEVAALVAAGEGAPGRALRYAGFDLPAIDAAVRAIAADGDPGNARRTALARTLSGKTAQARYEAFLDRAPSFLAAAARTRQGTALPIVLDAYESARSLAGAAIGLSLDPQTTVFEMAGLIARLAPPR